LFARSDKSSRLWVGTPSGWCQWNVALWPAENIQQRKCVFFLIQTIKERWNERTALKPYCNAIAQAFKITSSVYQAGIGVWVPATLPG
jgi:hypothetical protein